MTIINGHNLNDYYIGTPTGRLSAAEITKGERIVEAHLNGNGDLRVTLNISCPRCGGTGVYLHYGTCFRCGGTRRVEEASTYRTADKLDRASARLAKKQEAQRAVWAQERERIAAFEQANPALFWMLYKHVDNDDERRKALDRLADYGWSAVGEDAKARVMATDYNNIREHYDEHRATSSFAAAVLRFVSEGKTLTPKMQEACDRMVERQVARRAEAERKIALGHLAEPGTQMTVEAEIERLVVVDGRFGTCWIVGLRAATGHALVYKGGTIWWDSLPVDDDGNYVTKGNPLTISFKVKGHEEYKGIPQTRIERVKVAK